MRVHEATHGIVPSVRADRIAPEDLPGQPAHGGSPPPDVLLAERSGRWARGVVWLTLALAFVGGAVYLVLT